MRIERSGKVIKLTPRLECFFQEALGGIALDSIQHAESRKADYKCLNGILAIELKSLEEDASERIENLTNELREQFDWPIFYGSVPIQSFLKHVSNPEIVRRQFIDRIGRSIKNHMHKANKQLTAHETNFPRKNTVKMLVLVNEDHEVYDPELVAYIVQHHLCRHENGALLHSNIDAVIYVSERHVTIMEERLAFPILCIEGPSISLASWKREVTELFLTRWARWNSIPFHESDLSKVEFSTIEHIPDEMQRYKKWELDYKRNPYMRDFTNKQLQERFDESLCVSSLMAVKSSPYKPDRNAVIWSMSSFSHVMLEMNWRGIPVTEFPYKSENLAAAAQRLGFTSNVVLWFKNDLGRAVTL